MLTVCDAIDICAQRLRKQSRVRFLPLLVAAFLAVFVSGCGTRLDPLLRGAATGAMVGGLLQGTGRDVARGAAIGAVGGYVLGRDEESGRYEGSSCERNRAYFAPAEPVGDGETCGREKSLTWGQL